MQVFLADSGGHVRAAAEKLIAQATQWSCSGNRNELWERDFWAQHQGRAGKCIQIKHKKEGEKFSNTSKLKKRQGDLVKMLIPSGSITELRKKKHIKRIKPKLHSFA